MMKTVMVRYKTSSLENAEKNAALIRAVFEELRAKAPAGIRYTASRMEDGVTFIHYATHEGPPDGLTQLPAFKEFQRELKSRCAEPPVVSELSPVGTYEAR